MKSVLKENVIALVATAFVVGGALAYQFNRIGNKIQNDEPAPVVKSPCRDSMQISKKCEM